MAPTLVEICVSLLPAFLSWYAERRKEPTRNWYLLGERGGERGGERWKGGGVEGERWKVVE